MVIFLFSIQIVYKTLAFSFPLPAKTKKGFVLLIFFKTNKGFVLLIFFKTKKGFVLLIFLTSMAGVTKRYAVVTGANKGIGLEICKQLAQNRIIVVLTARDEKRGLDALQNLKHSGLSDYLVFHQLDVADPESIASLADFVKKQFGKLDILVNNAGILGATFSIAPGTEVDSNNIWSKATYNYDLAEECLKINYYGAKRTAEALIPLLQLSDLPRIVNVSSSIVMFKNGDKLKGVLTGITTEERLGELISEYLKDFKEGLLESRGWPTLLSAYAVSKIALNAYTRILANKYPDFCINSVCPGYAKTDINYNTGPTTVEQGAAVPVKLALLPKGGPSGLFFMKGEPTTPELDDRYNNNNEISSQLKLLGLLES